MVGPVARAFPDDELLIELLSSPYRDLYFWFAREVEQRVVEVPVLTLADFDDEPDPLDRAYADLRRLAALRKNDPSLELVYQEQLDEVRRLEQAEADEFAQAFEARWGGHLQAIDAALAAIERDEHHDEGPPPTHGATGCRD
ncbi:MAG: hypothetical protein QME96_14755 [Myxococcota bacterium]|nr:hypothetical protein [Myxococcota bacterium]